METRLQQTAENIFASFLLGVPNQQDFRPALFTYNYQWDSGAVFAQNDWKIRPNFTLNLGLRYSLQKPRTEANNQQGVFRPDLAATQMLSDAQRRSIATNSGILAADPIPSYVPTTATIVPFAFSGRGGRSRYIVPVDKKAFEPHFGFAWSPRMRIFGMDLRKGRWLFAAALAYRIFRSMEIIVRLIPTSARSRQPVQVRPVQQAGRIMRRQSDSRETMRFRVSSLSLWTRCLELTQMDSFS